MSLWREVWKPCWVDLLMRLIQQDLMRQQKAGPRSTLRGSRMRFKWVEMMCEGCRQSHGSPVTGCYELTILALIHGDTQPSNLLSAQFQWTMEFRACRYTVLLSALRLAARLMRLRLPTGEPNGVKTKVLLWKNNSSLHYCSDRCWLLVNTPALSRKYIYTCMMWNWKSEQTAVDVVCCRVLKCRLQFEERIDIAFWRGMHCKSLKTLNDVQVDLLL